MLLTRGVEAGGEAGLGGGDAHIDLNAAQELSLVRGAGGKGATD